MLWPLTKKSSKRLEGMLDPSRTCSNQHLFRILQTVDLSHVYNFTEDDGTKPRDMRLVGKQGELLTLDLTGRWTTCWRTPATPG